MKAATIADGGVVPAERPDPVAGNGELLVRVEAAGVNGADLMQARGLYPAPPGCPPDIPGLELAGEVVEVGEGVTRFSAGDRVMAIVGAARRPSWRWSTSGWRCRCLPARLGTGRRFPGGVHHGP